MKVILAICTCNRPEWLSKLLDSISYSDGEFAFDLEVLIVDNYKSGNAKAVYLKYIGYRFPLNYIQEKRPGIPFARNNALDWSLSRRAGAIIFVDDDEIVRKDWLNTLVNYYIKRQPYVQVVQGPVHPVFLSPLPYWIPEDVFCKKHPYQIGSKKRANHSGTRLRIASTNNVIIDLGMCKTNNFRFNERMALSGGSDNDFFRRLDHLGYRIEWCNDAITDEYVPLSRISLSWLVKRYYRYGACTSYSLLMDEGMIKAIKKQVKAATRQFFMAFLRMFKINRYCFVYFLRHVSEGVGMIAGLTGIQYNEYKKYHE